MNRRVRGSSTYNADLFTSYRLVIFETSARTAWISSGAQEVIEEAPKRLEREGWQSVRPALSLTVR